MGVGDLGKENEHKVSTVISWDPKRGVGEIEVDGQRQNLNIHSCVAFRAAGKDSTYNCPKYTDLTGAKLEILEKAADGKVVKAQVIPPFAVKTEAYMKQYKSGPASYEVGDFYYHRSPCGFKTLEKAIQVFKANFRGYISAYLCPVVERYGDFFIPNIRSVLPSEHRELRFAKQDLTRGLKYYPGTDLKDLTLDRETNRYVVRGDNEFKDGNRFGDYDETYIQSMSFTIQVGNPSRSTNEQAVAYLKQLGIGAPDQLKNLGGVLWKVEYNEKKIPNGELIHKMKEKKLDEIRKRASKVLENVTLLGEKPTLPSVKLNVLIGEQEVVIEFSWRYGKNEKGIVTSKCEYDADSVEKAANKIKEYLESKPETIPNWMGKEV